MVTATITATCSAQTERSIGAYKSGGVECFRSRFLACSATRPASTITTVRYLQRLSFRVWTGNFMEQYLTAPLLSIPTSLLARSLSLLVWRCSPATCPRAPGSHRLPTSKRGTTLGRSTSYPPKSCDVLFQIALIWKLVCEHR